MPTVTWPASGAHFTCFLHASNIPLSHYPNLGLNHPSLSSDHTIKIRFKTLIYLHNQQVNTIKTECIITLRYLC